MKEFILIDGNYWLFSSYYATAVMGNLMVNKDGIPTNAVFGFANRLESILKKNPECIVIAFDAKGKTFRSDMLEEYKATRKETPEELKAQFPIVREFLDAHHIPHYELEGYEGDDIIGTLAKKAEKEGYKVSIYTGDKDMMQLVDDHISVSKRNTKTKNDDEITPAVFKEKYDLIPDQMRDLLGLMGDSADNIPGIKGIGEKTALKLLNQYQTIENIKDHIHELKGKLKEKIETNIDVGIQSKVIATILTDIPLELSLDECIYQGFDYHALKSFYQKYDMNSLLKRMTIETVVEDKKNDMDYKIVTSLPQITQDSAIYASIYDTNYHKSFILGYGIYNKDQAYYISFDKQINFQLR